MKVTDEEPAHFGSQGQSSVRLGGSSEIHIPNDATTDQLLRVLSQINLMLQLRVLGDPMKGVGLVRRCSCGYALGEAYAGSGPSCKGASAGVPPFKHTDCIL